MIDPKELRVGNYVDAYYFNDTTKQMEVRWINDECVLRVEKQSKIKSHTKYESFKYLYDAIFPITITPEWLERLGFTHFKTEPTIIGSMTGEDGSEEYWQKSLLVIKNFGTYWQNVIGFFTEIKSVHQLQNLYFALTGEELIIKQWR